MPHPPSRGTGQGLMGQLTANSAREVGILNASSTGLRMRIKRVAVLTGPEFVEVEMETEGKLFLVCLHNRTREVCLPASATDDASGDVARLDMAIRQRFSDLSTMKPTSQLIIQVRVSFYYILLVKSIFNIALAFVPVGSDFCSWQYR